MDIQIITTSDVALYEQIATQIKKLIINGSLQEGDPLPSVRALAQELGVSAITTRRAYTELEQEGYVFTAPAKGTFVSHRYIERLKELGLMKLGEMMDDMIYLARAMNIEQEQLLELVTERYLEVSESPDYKSQLVKLKRNPGRYYNRRY